LEASSFESIPLRGHLDAYAWRIVPGGWFFPSPAGRAYDIDSFSSDLKRANEAASLNWTVRADLCGVQISQVGSGHYWPRLPRCGARQSAASSAQRRPRAGPFTSDRVASLHPGVGMSGAIPIAASPAEGLLAGEVLGVDVPL
jgi:hypothetical protein